VFVYHSFSFSFIYFFFFFFSFVESFFFFFFFFSFGEGVKGGLSKIRQIFNNLVKILQCYKTEL